MENNNENQLDRHSLNDPFESKPINKDKDEYIRLPTHTFNKIRDFYNEIQKIPNDIFQQNWNEDYINVVNDMQESSKYTSVDNVGYKEDVDYVNRVEYGDSKLNLIRLKQPTSKGAATGTSAIIRLKKFLNIGEPILVPLWHSGFWVTITPPTQAEIINLEIAITDNEINLGRHTGALIYSNYSVVINRILTYFILEHIDQWSLKCSKDQLLDHISIHDYHLLVLGLITTMYPKGIKLVKNCKNATILNDSQLPKCTHELTGIIDPKKLLFLDRKALSDKMLEHMSQKQPSSMSIESIKEYKHSISSLIDRQYDLVINDNTIKLTLSSPTLRTYIKSGEDWVNNIIKAVEGLFTESSTPEDKNKLVNKMAVNSMLGKYSTFVSSIEFGEEKIVDNPTITMMLNDIVPTEDVFEPYIKALENFITESPIAIVGTPNYECPSCGELQQDIDNRFKEIIPLNVVNHFFALSVFRLTKMKLEKTLEE